MTVREPRKLDGGERSEAIARRARERTAKVVGSLGVSLPASPLFNEEGDQDRRVLTPGARPGGVTKSSHGSIRGLSHLAEVTTKVVASRHQRFTGVTFRSDGTGRVEQVRVSYDLSSLDTAPGILFDHCVFVRANGSWKTHIVVDSGAYAVFINPTFIGGTEDDPDGTTACVIQNNAALANVVVIGGHNDTGNCLGNVTTFGMPLGGPSTSITTITVNTTLTGAYGIVLVDASAASVTVTLPAAADYKEKLFSIKKIDSGPNIVTVAAASGETIDDVASKIIPVQYVSIDVVSDGTEWWIV